MDIIVGESYIIDNKLYRSEEINFQFNNSEYIIYEVIRTTKGLLFFLDDHLERLYSSLQNLNLEIYYNASEIRNLLYRLILHNYNREGNIKLLCKPSNTRMQYAAFYVPYFYPPKEMYTEGIKLTSYIIERKDPHIKQIHINEKIKQEINDVKLNSSAFEILLVNQKGYVTEGSKSNFFLIKGSTLYSAPEEWILKGITRKYVLEIANKLGFENVPLKIKINDVQNFEAGFICGTSSKVMPVKEIDGHLYSVGIKTLQLIKENYDTLFEDYIKTNLK
jgi:branched-chain amino acid aminotransferase